MKKIDFHVTLSERYMQVMDSFAQKDDYGSRRKVLEHALELLQAADKADIEEILKTHKLRNCAINLFNYLLTSADLVDGLGCAALERSGLDKAFEKFFNSAAKETEYAQKIAGKRRINTFSDLAETIKGFHRDLNVLGSPHINEEDKFISARINLLKSIPELILLTLNAKLEASGYTFKIALHDGENPIVIITWIPTEDYPEVKKQRERYINSKREALKTKTKGLESQL